MQRSLRLAVPLNYFISMGVREVPFSELQNRGKAAVSEWLAAEGGRPLRVTRRDAEDLVLMTAARADQEHEVVSAAAAVLRALVASGETGVFRAAVVAAFAWAQLLSDEEVDQFAAELADSPSVGASLDNPAPSALTIEAWRHTAEVYADPELARILASATDGDVGAAPAPHL